MKKQQGFTLIELIVVIVILGILSAFALPRFADLGTEARESTINGVLGAVRSAQGIVRAEVLVQNAVANSTILLEGVTIDLFNGFADASDGGLCEAAQIGGPTNDGGVICTDTSAGVTISLESQSTCQFLVSDSTGAGIAPVIGPISQAGCI